MSEQLTLADVEAGHHIRILETGLEYWYDGVTQTPACGAQLELWAVPYGQTRWVDLQEAKTMPVELMELVPKDREQSLRPWEKAERLSEPWECYSDFQTWFRKKVAPTEGIDPDNDAAWEKFLEDSPVLAKATLYSVFCEAVDAARPPKDRESDLLEALEAAMPHIECLTQEQNGIINMCGRAIAKHKGESA